MKKIPLLSSLALVFGLSVGFYVGALPYHWRLLLGLDLPKVKILTQRADLFSKEVEAVFFHMSGAIIEVHTEDQFDEFLQKAPDYDLLVADSTWLRKMTPQLSPELFQQKWTGKISTDFLTERIEHSESLPIFWKAKKVVGTSQNPKDSKYDFTIWAVAQNKDSVNAQAFDVVNVFFSGILHRYWLMKLDLSSCLKIGEELKIPVEKKPSFLRDQLIYHLK